MPNFCYLDVLPETLTIFSASCCPNSSRDEKILFPFFGGNSFSYNFPFQFYQVDYFIIICLLNVSWTNYICTFILNCKKVLNSWEHHKMHLFTVTFSHLNMVVFLAFLNFAFHMNYSAYVFMNNVLWNILDKLHWQTVICRFLLFGCLCIQLKYWWDSLSFKVSVGRNTFSGYTISLRKNPHFIYLLK